MIINKDAYYCDYCKKSYFFETSKPYSDICPVCNRKLIFRFNGDCDTELAEKVKNTPPYDPTKDPDSIYYIPVIECPTCHSRNTQKIGMFERGTSVALLGLFSKKINKSFKCNSCGYTW